MAQVLHKQDEETDVGAYQAYLRAQSDADLLDIVRHLDPERYPARLDAAHREARRRHVLQAPVYTTTENVVRGVCVGGFLLAAVTLALAWFLTPADVAGPAWPDMDALPDGTLAIQVMHLFGVAVLRALVVWSVHLGLYPLALLTPGWWAVTRAPRVWRQRARFDVWRLTVASVVVLGVAVALSAFSAVPSLFAPADSWPWAERALTLLEPFA